MCELPVAIGNNVPWNCWPIWMVDSYPQDGENILLSGEGPDHSIEKKSFDNITLARDKARNKCLKLGEN